MPYIIFFFKIRMIFSLVAMTGLEKCCITSAYLQWLYSGEWPVGLFFISIGWCLKQATHPIFGILVYFSSVTIIMDKVLISISGQKNNESYPLCSLDQRSIPDPHFILNLAILHEQKPYNTFFTLVLKDLLTTQQWSNIS